jgi:hypothetical protein
VDDFGDQADSLGVGCFLLGCVNIDGGDLAVISVTAISELLNGGFLQTWLVGTELVLRVQQTSLLERLDG